MKEYILNTPIKGSDAKPGDLINLGDKAAEPLLACGAVTDPEAVAAAKAAQETPVKTDEQTQAEKEAAEKEAAEKEAAEKEAAEKEAAKKPAAKATVKAVK